MENTENLYNLSNLIGMIGDDKIAIIEFVNLFLETSAITLQQMNDSFAENNYSSLGSLAHKLKSSIDLMGIESLKTDIRAIERDCKDLTNLQIIPELMGNINNVLKEVYIQMQKELE